MRAWPLILALLIAGAGVSYRGADSPAQADQVGTAVVATLGVDANPTASPANTATSVGSIEPCHSVSVGNTFTVDIFVKDIAELGKFSFLVSYNGNVINILSNQVRDMFMGDGYFLIDDSDPTPDSESPFFISVTDLFDVHSGSGVLARLTVQAVANGASQLNLVGAALLDGGFQPIPFSGPLNGEIRVGEACPLPDTDGDGVPDASDNCPNTPNPDQEDGDSDTVGDACDNCPNTPNPGQENTDGDEWGNACENCPTVATPWFVPAGDDDCDGFTTALENYLGTNPLVRCGASAWPPDTNDNGTVNNLDLVLFTLSWAKSTGEEGFDQRVDLNQNGTVNNLDFLPLLPFWQMSCIGV